MSTPWTVTTARLDFRTSPAGTNIDGTAYAARLLGVSAALEFQAPGGIAEEDKLVLARAAFDRHAAPLATGLEEARTLAALTAQHDSMVEELRRAENDAARAALDAEKCHLDGLTGAKLAKRLADADAAAAGAKARAADLAAGLRLFAGRLDAARAGFETRTRQVAADAHREAHREIEDRRAELHQQIAAAAGPLLDELARLQATSTYLASEGRRWQWAREAATDGAGEQTTCEATAPA